MVKSGFFRVSCDAWDISLICPNVSWQSFGCDEMLENAMVSQVSASAVSVTPRSRGHVLLTAAMLFAFGIGLVYVSGFANADALHNGAHDSRHSLVFPCH